MQAIDYLEVLIQHVYGFKTFQENHQALAGDVHTVEESLAMVDDCFNLLDKSKIPVINGN